MSGKENYIYHKNGQKKAGKPMCMYSSQSSGNCLVPTVHLAAFSDVICHCLFLGLMVSAFLWIEYVPIDLKDGDIRPLLKKPFFI